jgi:HAD superfamily hydrolase (TIGR01450 family)
VSGASLAAVKGFVFDLDGCVWTWPVLSPGAGEALAALRRAGRRIAFLTNNSRLTGDEIRERLAGLGVTGADAYLTPLEIIGETIRERYGLSRVLVIGAVELADMLRRAGHEVVDVKDYRRATLVAVGNDFDLSYERLTAAARAASAGAPLVTPNLDARMPIEGDFLPGCGAIVAAVTAAANVTPFVIGKPEPPLFDIALRRMNLAAPDAAMVGDSIPSDIMGGKRMGMRTILYAPDGGPTQSPADVTIRSFEELAKLAGV